MSFKITKAEGNFLVKLARKTISTYLDKGEKILAPSNIPQKLHEKCGVFVTINTIKDGVKELRGCIGYPEPKLPLVEATIASAINAAVRDLRFPPLSKNELKNVVIELSVLTPPELIIVENRREYVDKIEIGIDGLIIEKGYHKGLLLPQVPIEWRWNQEEFLINCCMKAGLYPDAWLDKGIKIYKFSCVIARETYPNGPIEIIDMHKGEKS